MSSSAQSDLQISELQSKQPLAQTKVDYHKKSTLEASSSESPEKQHDRGFPLSDSEDPSDGENKHEKEEDERVKRHTEMALQAAKKFDYSFDSSDYGDESETNSQFKKSVAPLPKGTIQEDSDEDLVSDEQRSRQNGANSNKSPSDNQDDFYKLSDLEASSAKKQSHVREREPSSSAIKIDVAANASAFADSSYMESSMLSASQQQRQTSLAKISCLLDSHLVADQSDVRDLVENEKQLYRSEMPKDLDKEKIVLNFMGSGLGVNKPQTEMTFGDLSSSEHSRVQPVTTDKEQVCQEEKQPAPSDKSLQEDLDLLSNSCFTLSNSQLSQFKSSLQNPTTLRGYQISKGLDRSTTRETAPVVTAKAAGLVLTILQTYNEKLSAKKAFSSWRLFSRSAFYQDKVQNAAQMVDRMSKFSRNFISLNSLSAIVKKHQQRQLCKSMIRWVRASQKKPQQQPVPPRNDHEMLALKAQIERQKDLLAQKDTQLAKKDQIITEKEAEIAKTESMFKEYQNWRGKLEMIETRMKQEVEHWKDVGEKLQRENTMLQKETLKMSKELMDRAKQVKTQSKELEKLKEKADVVEEALCQKCQNSLEESFYGETPKKQELPKEAEHHHVSREELVTITEQMSNLEKQLLKYRERVSYHESMEEELKKNLEQQVDVILKMEEERLVLLKEHKESQEGSESLEQEKQGLLDQIDTLKGQIHEFDGELKELKEEIKAQQKSQKENKNVTNNTAKKTPVSTTVRRPQTASVSKPSLNLKKTPSTLKFQQPPKSSPETQVCSSCKVSIKNKQLQNDPATKSLAQDNQMLTNELVLLNRELAKMKAEGRSYADTHKKSEKENHEFRKQIGSKDNALEKLRKERDELWAIVNTDKYKSIRCVESEKEQFEIQVANLESQLKKAQMSISTGSEEVDELKGQVQELQYEGERLRERDSARERLINTLEGKARRYEQEVDESTSQNSVMREEFEQIKTENGQLKQDLSWLANQAKNSKAQADKALADLQSYTQILRGLEKKLAEVNQEKAACQEELMQTQQSFMTVMQKHQVSATGASVTANVTKPQMNVWIPQTSSMPPTPSSYPSQHF